MMMVAGAFLEALGVSLVLPLVSAITNPNIIESNRYISEFCAFLGIHSAKTFIIAVILSLIFVYIFKNLYLFVEYYAQSRFICNNRFEVQQRLMKAYLHRPYEYFLNAGSGEIMQVIGNDSSNTFTLLKVLLDLFTEGFVSTVLIITIIAADAFMAFLIAGVMGGMMLVIGKVLKPVLRRAGNSFRECNAKTNKWLLQAIGGIKEVKIAQREDYFLEQYSKYGRRAISAEKKNMVLANVPRLSIEAFGISSMLAVIAILLMRGREVSSMLPQLSAFAMAAVRLMPSVNRMSSSLNSISYYAPSLDKMIENLDEAKKWENAGQTVSAGKKTENSAEKKPAAKEKICLEKITYSYPNAAVCVLENADMEIPAGKSVGIVGTSGSGKTTAVDILLGLLPPKKGNVLSDGKNIRDEYSDYLRGVGYIPQMIFMLDDTIRANIAFGLPRNETDEEKVWNALEEAQLKDFVESLPDGLDTTIGERGVRLSGGQRQRIGIARALYSDPSLLIFDEATSALDNETEAAIMESINALHGRKTMIIIAHRLTTIKECDLVYRVENGKIKRER
jgi:ABC-type multidrug transport system fused ATPase/permease subunit